jgi:hypothetical protein
MLLFANSVMKSRCSVFSVCELCLSMSYFFFFFIIIDSLMRISVSYITQLHNLLLIDLI